MRSNLFFGSVLAFGLTVAATGADASVLYATTYNGTTSDSALYTLNQSTGAATLVGNMQVSVGDLTSRTNGGPFQLWGIDIGANALWTINPSTGATSNEVSITGTQGPITSIAFDPVTQTLFGNTTAGFGGADQLYEINPTTGAATLEGAIGSSNVYALGFTQSGTLLGESNATGNLLSINTSTGAGTVIGPTGLAAIYDLASRPEDGVVFGVDSNPGTFSLYTFNISTGAPTLVGPYGASLNLAGLAFSAVPEPATWAMMLVGFAGLAYAGFRRAKARPAIA
jgi:hypothetical protein